MKLVATSYLSNKGIQLNNELIQAISSSDDNWLKSIYTALDCDYPKFHKMDNLSKMAFLCSTVLNEILATIPDKEEDLQLIFANASSSQVTDLKFIDSYQIQGAPSPSLFVYTLPNIVTGELAIRNKWYGENIFLISEKMEETLFENQIEFAFKKGNSHCLCSWVESNKDGNEECFVFLVSNSDESSKNFTTELTNRLNQYRNE